MSAVAYSNPYKLPAGLLAGAVHAVFFVLMYFGVTWQAQPPQGMVVDIWQSLPELKNIPVKTESAPPQKIQPAPPVEVPIPVEPVRAVAPPQADIQLPAKEKQPPKVDPVKPPVAAPVKPPVQEPPKPTEAELKKEALDRQEALAQLEAQNEALAKKEALAQAEQSAQIEQARVRAEAAAQAGKVVDEYVAKIQAKIRSNIIRPPDVPRGARAEFSVTLLPGGTVLNMRLTKRSGDDAYDTAVERAILKSQPLPLPPDAALFNKFRELKLGFNSYDSQE